jgi:hypothetical protein
VNGNASYSLLVSMDHYMELEASNVPRIAPKDCGIT